MAGGPEDFGGTKELVQLFGPPKAGRTKELGGPKCKSEQTAGGTTKLNVLLKTQIEVHYEII